MQRYTVYFIWRLLYMFRVVPQPIIRSANNCIYSIWYLSHRYCYLPLSWKSWNWFECAEGGVRSSISSTIAAGSSIGLTIPDAVCTALCSWWWTEVPPETYRAIYRKRCIFLVVFWDSLQGIWVRQTSDNTIWNRIMQRRDSTKNKLYFYGQFNP